MMKKMARTIKPARFKLDNLSGFWIYQRANARSINRKSIRCHQQHKRTKIRGSRVAIVAPCAPTIRPIPGIFFKGISQRMDDFLERLARGPRA